MVPVSTLFPVPDSSPQTTREHVSPLIFTSPEAKKKNKKRKKKAKKKKKNTEAGEEEGKADQNIECEGYGETNQRRKREKKKTLQSAARVEKEIPVRARHWRDASAMDIRKGGRR